VLSLIVLLAPCRLDRLENSLAHGKPADLAAVAGRPSASGVPATAVRLSQSRIAPKGAEDTDDDWWRGKFQRRRKPKPPPVVTPPPPEPEPAEVVAPPPPLWGPPPPGPGGLPIVSPLATFPAPGPGPPEPRVAVLLPLSGANGGLGAAMLDAAQLALFEIAADDLVLLPYDTLGTSEGAAAAAAEAVRDRAGLILGPLFAAAARQVGPIARGAGVNVVSFSNDRTIAGGNLFVMGFVPDDEVSAVVEFARERGLLRFAGLAPNTPYGDRVVRTLQEVIARQGGELTRVAFYEPTDEDIAPVVRQLADYDRRALALKQQRRELEVKNDPVARRALKRLEGLETIGDVGFDAVLLAEGGDRLRAIAPLLPYYDVDPAAVRFLGTGQWDDPTLTHEPALLGGWFAAPPPDRRLDFVGRYERIFGQPPPRLATLAYDATALAALLARGPGGADFRAEALTRPGGFAGVDGIFRFRPEGVVERGLAVLQLGPTGQQVIRQSPSQFADREAIN
jgi:ABC-type branched-subunit amino acid transport system substrate-binding protein